MRFIEFRRRNGARFLIDFASHWEVDDQRSSEQSTPEAGGDSARYAFVRGNLCDSQSTLLEDAFELAGCIGRFPSESEFDFVVDTLIAAQGEKT